MYEDPEDDGAPSDRPPDPATAARERSDEFRMHAELAAVFEAHRKYDVAILPGLDPDVARDVQRTIGRLEKSKAADSPLLPDASVGDAHALLMLPDVKGLSTGDYHVSRRPGETMIVRWLAGEQVQTFYERLQAHFDAALEGFKEDERQAKAWKQDPKTLEYLNALDAIDVKMAERYLREPIKALNLFVLSTQSADEINIAYLCEDVMGATPAEVVGQASAPPDGPSEQDLAWFFKLFSLRGMHEGVERMCFFAYLQKSDDGGW